MIFNLHSRGRLRESGGRPAVLQHRMATCSLRGRPVRRSGSDRQPVLQPTGHAAQQTWRDLWDAAQNTHTPDAVPDSAAATVLSLLISHV